VELVVKDTTDSPNPASYLDLDLEHDINGTLTTKLYDERDDFNFPIVNYPFLDSNISSSSRYGVYMSQLIRYSRTCNSYQDCLRRSVLLTRKLLNQDFIETRLISILKKILVVTIIWHSLIVTHWPPWLMTYVGHDIVVMSTFHSLIRHRGHHAPNFTSGFHRGSCCPVICVAIFHVIVLSFVFWVLIVPLVWLLCIYIFYFFKAVHSLTIRFGDWVLFLN